MRNNEVILVGAGGNCIALLDLLDGSPFEISGVVDTRECLDLACFGIAYLGNDDRAPELYAAGVRFAVITVAAPLSTRARILAHYRSLGFSLPTLISPEAFVSCRAVVEEGAAIYPGANIGAGVTIGRDAIVNANAVVAHGAHVGSCSHLAPNATLLGNVKVGSGTLVGAGSVVLPGVDIGSNCMIGAGSVVLSDIPDGAVFVGNPAHRIR